MSRRRFTERQALKCAIQQGAIIPCYRCNMPFTVETIRTAEREHLHEIALDGPDTVDNCAYSCRDCHSVVTRGTGATTAGTSVGKAAKDKRIAKGKMAVDKPPTGTERPQRAHKRRIPNRVNAWPARGSRPMNKPRRA